MRLRSLVVIAALVLSGTIAMAADVSGSTLGVGVTSASFTNAQGIYVHMQKNHSECWDPGSIDLAPGEQALIPAVFWSDDLSVTLAVTTWANNVKKASISNAAFAVEGIKNEWEAPEMDIRKQGFRDPGDWLVIHLDARHFRPGRNNFAIVIGDRGSNHRVVGPIGTQSVYMTNMVVIPIDCIAPDDAILGEVDYRANPDFDFTQRAVFLRKVEVGWKYNTPAWIDEAISRGTMAQVKPSGAIAPAPTPPSPPPAAMQPAREEPSVRESRPVVDRRPNAYQMYGGRRRQPQQLESYRPPAGQTGMIVTVTQEAAGFKHYRQGTSDRLLRFVEKEGQPALHRVKVTMTANGKRQSAIEANGRSISSVSLHGWRVGQEADIVVEAWDVNGRQLPGVLKLHVIENGGQ